MENDFVYVLLIENVLDSINERNVKVFSNLKDANYELLRLKEKFEEECEQIMETETNVDNGDVETDLFYFTAFESGDYNNDHYELTIYQREVDEE